MLYIKIKNIAIYEKINIILNNFENDGYNISFNR